MTATASSPTTHRDLHDLLAGAGAMLPWLVGVVPFGLVIGVTVASSPVSHLAGWLTGPLVYAGSAQLAVVELLGSGALPVVVVATVLVINARLVLYSASLAPGWRGTPLWWRLLAAYFVVDPSFAVGTDAYRDHPGRPGHLRYLGASMLLWLAWVAAITTGLVAGAGLPAWLHLELAVPLYLVGQVTVMAADDPARRWTAGAAAVAAVASTAMPLHLDLVAAIAVGVAVGVRRERATEAVAA